MQKLAEELVNMHGTEFNLHVGHKADQAYVQGRAKEPADELVTITSTIVSFLFSPRWHPHAATTIQARSKNAYDLVPAPEDGPIDAGKRTLRIGKTLKASSLVSTSVAANSGKVVCTEGSSMTIICSNQ